MIEVNELKPGVTFTMDGELYKVLEYQHHKPGRGKATIRTKLRNLRTGSTIQHNFISGDRVTDIRIERREVQYLYNDGTFYYFMDKETYDQMVITAGTLEEVRPYLREETELAIAMYEGEPLDVLLPAAVELEVVECEMAVAGDTATGATKRATMQTGLTVQVPLFVEVGDVLRVDTRSGEYITRV
ncbi:MAG: elongation factor P [Anaerolineae bacterium]|nr:elongation factor P [Anaerolineae bacterium]